MREQAWQLDGWADTVSKVRFGSLFPQSMLSLTDARRASCAADGADGEVHGLVRDGPALVQPAQVTRDLVCARGSSTMQRELGRGAQSAAGQSYQSQVFRVAGVFWHLVLYVIHIFSLEYISLSGHPIGAARCVLLYRLLGPNHRRRDAERSNFERRQLPRDRRSMQVSVHAEREGERPRLISN